MNEEQFKQLMDVLNEILDSVQTIEDTLYDADTKEHQKKVEWNLWEIHNLAKFIVKGRNGTLESLPDSRPPRDAERGTQTSEEEANS